MMPLSQPLNSRIPTEPSMGTMRPVQHLLLAGRIPANPHNQNLTATSDSSGYRHTLRGGVSR
jgi:hypothetical protein